MRRRDSVEKYIFSDTKDLDENGWFQDPDGSRNPGTNGSKGGILLRGVKGGGFARRKDTRAQPHIQPHTGIVPVHEGGFRPQGRAVLMRTTCVGGVPRICDTSILGAFPFDSLSSI